LKTRCGMYECMEFIPPFLRWWVTNLAGRRYSLFKCLFGIQNHSMEHELRIHQWAAHWRKDPWQIVLWTEVKANGECVEYPSLNCTLRENSMVHNWKFLSDLHIWGKDKGPMRPNLQIHQSSAHWRQRCIGHVQWKVWMYRLFSSLKVLWD
jgi:hypothetical protein